MFNLKRYSQENKLSKDLFAVFWTGQLREWYGDDNFKVGRYKNKGQGGQVLAINIPTFDMAKKVKVEMERKLFEPRNLVYTYIKGKEGRDMFLVDYDGISVTPMVGLFDYFYIKGIEEIKSWAHPKLFVDYGGIEDREVRDEELGEGGKELLNLLG